jgi:TRAP-type C4-dicarboxylate transport system permease large subunit
VTGVSIGALFLAGAIPGVLAGLAMMMVTWYLAPRAGGRPTPRATLPDVRRASGQALPALLMPLIIIGGIMSGAFTPTEAGAVAALYAILFGLATRRHTAPSLYANFPSAASVTAGALITLGGAALFSWILSRAGAGAMALRRWSRSRTTRRWRSRSSWPSSSWWGRSSSRYPRSSSSSP